MKNRGVITFTRYVWVQLFGCAQLDVIRQTLPWVRQILLLPEEYEVVGIDERDDFIDVLVASESIPESTEGVPLLKPFYTRNYVLEPDGYKTEQKFDHMVVYK